MVANLERKVKKKGGGGVVEKIQCGFDPPTLAVEDFTIPLLLSRPPQKASVSAPKKRKQPILSFGRSGRLQVLRNDKTSPEKESGEHFLLPNLHTDRSFTTVLLGRFLDLLFQVNKPDSNSIISLNNSKCTGS